MDAYTVTTNKAAKINAMKQTLQQKKASHKEYLHFHREVVKQMRDTGSSPAAKN